MPKRKSTFAGTSMTLYVKNMVCDRCIRVVTQELENIGLDVRSVTLGEVTLTGNSRDLPMEQIRKTLGENGFELIEDRKARTIEQLKLAIIRLIREPGDRKLKYSAYLSKELGLEYHYLSTLFSSVENVTIEQYIIRQRVERAKELLKYGEMTLSEIAYELGYSSVQHLSNQFKHITGLTPTQFKRMTINMRNPLDHVS
ncbi:MAG: helix-turn-helix domain-containing protein [Ignavibacteriales bacterium]|nr:helix-turn-helix domain-containing protein [Ignavibacteriales bacterium]